MKTRSMVSFDWAMKNLLRNKANFEVLEGFLSELLCRKIVIKYIGESEGNKTDKDDKTNRVDVFVEADDKELVIIELQYDYEYDYFQRMLYGVSKSILEHISSGDHYSKIRKVYSVNIVHFDLGAGDDYLYHGTTVFRGMHTQTELQLTEKQKKIYAKKYISDLYPEYFVILLKNFDKEAENPLDEWIYYFKTSKIKDEFKAKGMDKAREVLEYENLTDAEKKAYWENVEARRVRDSEIFSSFIDGKDEGLSEGLEKGEAIGLEKGEAIGLEKGKVERDKLKNQINQIAINAYKTGMSIEEISKMTGLTIEEIKTISGL
jgi:predicted transposase/invertase (TIGR01784 family)